MLIGIGIAAGFIISVIILYGLSLMDPTYTERPERLRCTFRGHEWIHGEYWTGLSEIIRYKECAHCGCRHYR